MATKGYTLEEMFEFGFYDWTLTHSRPATAEEVKWGCGYYEDCPCCECGEDVVMVEYYARPRWSKSGKRMVEETDVVWFCVEHATK
jgi:hypothetical protein